MSLPKIRLERCAPLGPGLWRMDAEQAHHLTRVLRHYEGAMIEGLLGEDVGRRLSMRLEKRGEEFLLRAVDMRVEEPEKMKLTLLIGLLKADQFDSVLRACAELGVHALQPVVCERSVPRVDDREIGKKMLRWRKILDEGSKVSGSLYVPRIECPIPFDAFDWRSLPQRRYAALLSAGTEPLAAMPVLRGDFVFAVGPEGDWSDRETETLLAHDFFPVSLGSRILRASTAAIIACGWFRLQNF